jgi:uncharacterized protein YbaR (Trm112 family)
VKELLPFLCCPETGQALQPATPDLVKRLQEQCKAGMLKNRAGAAPDPFEDLLVTLDGSRIYPVRDGIPVLLLSEIL